MELTDLSCEICSLPLASCTCPDIDERIYNYDVMMEALRKQNPNRLDERMTRLLGISHFVAPEVQGVELITDTLQPWTGYRDKAFSKAKEVPHVDTGSKPGDAPSPDV